MTYSGQLSNMTYETMLLEKDPRVAAMTWINWKYIDANKDNFDAVHQSLTS